MAPLTGTLNPDSQTTAAAGLGVIQTSNEHSECRNLCREVDLLTVTQREGGPRLIDLIRGYSKYPMQDQGFFRYFRGNISCSNQKQATHREIAPAGGVEDLPVAEPLAHGRLVVGAVAVGVALAGQGCGVVHPEQATRGVAAQRRELC